jgi:hypothetical protein
MMNVDPKEVLEVAPGADEQPIQSLRPHGPNPSFADGGGSYEEPFASLLGSQEGAGSHKSKIVELIDRCANRVLDGCPLISLR